MIKKRPGYNFDFIGYHSAANWMNAPATFLRLMDSILATINGTETIAFNLNITLFSPDI